MENTEERTFYSGGTVKVTSARFVSGSKTYSLRNISSVEIGKVTPTKMVELTIILVGLVMFIPQGTRLFGVLVAALGVWLYVRRKPKYTVRINSNSGEADGYISQNKEEIEEIVAAVNRAMIN